MTHRNRKEVLFLPDWRYGNPYMERLSAGLQREGYNIYFNHYPHGYLKLTRLANAHPKVGVIHIHWVPPSFIDQLFWSRNRLKFGLRLVVLSIDLLLCRVRGLRIVWTLHNLVEHESPDPDHEVRVRALLAWFANAVIAHSEAALDLAEKTYGINLRRKGHVIPHGNYIGAYAHNDAIKQMLYRKYRIGPDDIVILFFGAIRQYKGLDQLLLAFRNVDDERLRLIIAGKPINEKVWRWLTQEAITDHRIQLSLEFVPEAQVAAHFALASAVVLPLQRVLTSGSVLLAMSLGKCLILPETARVLGVPVIAGILYYESQAALEKLLRGLREIDVAKMGASNLVIARQFDWAAIAAATAKVYSGNPATST